MTDVVNEWRSWMEKSVDFAEVGSMEERDICLGKARDLFLSLSETDREDALDWYNAWMLTTRIRCARFESEQAAEQEQKRQERQAAEQQRVLAFRESQRKYVESERKRQLAREKKDRENQERARKSVNRIRKIVREAARKYSHNLRIVCKEVVWRHELVKREEAEEARESETPATVGVLIGLLRKLAGINPTSDSFRKSKRRGEWSDWSHGKEGMRKCGPNAWDNAVRNYEEG